METTDGFEERFKKLIHGWHGDNNSIVNEDEFFYNIQKMKDFIRAEKKLSVDKEKQAWIRRERCSNCGEECLDNDLADMCSKCFEEA